jgi:hypothetical protein
MKRKPIDQGEVLQPGWVPTREVKDEPYVTNKNMALGSWLSRASKNSYASNPSVAPGTGSSKSS